ncbi:hypothetical protein PBRA_004307 [Plasmodiophora brassicae]|nr:hypothetical protein PBRA_004307 [Plasmodiophora brassicae]
MNFGQSFQTTRGEVAVVDEHLEKYIQRRLQDIQGDGSEVGDRDPSTKKRVRPGPDIEFSGIQEYSLPLDERLRKREAIEKAKREFVEDRCADADRVDVRTIPSNVGSNFNLHIAAPDDGTTGIAAESGGPTDQVVYDQFRKKHARTRR